MCVFRGGGGQKNECYFLFFGGGEHIDLCGYVVVVCFFGEVHF